jgi:hypothetical protein
MTDRCKSCHAPIRWVKMQAAGRPGTRPMPVDYLPASDGNVSVLANGLARVLSAAERSQALWPLYKSHFATCPNAVALRRRAR